MGLLDQCALMMALKFPLLCGNDFSPLLVEKSDDDSRARQFAAIDADVFETRFQQPQPLEPERNREFRTARKQ